MNFTHHDTHHNTNCTPKNVENVDFTDENDDMLIWPAKIGIWMLRNTALEKA